MSDWARHQVRSTLRNQGFRHTGPGADTYEGKIRFGAHSATVSINFVRLDFTVLPIVNLVDAGTLQASTIANLSIQGVVCYAAEGTLRLDALAPGKSALLVLDRVMKALEQSAQPGVPSIVANEFPRYWDGKPIYIAERLTSEEALLMRLNFAADREMEILAHKEPSRPFQVKQRKICRMFSSRADLTANMGIFPPNSVADLLTWVSEQNGFSPNITDDVLNSFSNSEAVLFKGNNGYVGAIAQGSPSSQTNRTKRDRNARHAPSRFPTSTEIVRFWGREADERSTVVRNNPDVPNLIGKRIGLIGCGTIGSHLGKFLVQNGAGVEGHLLIFDPDILEPGNIGRHLLGFEALSRNKAEALQEALCAVHHCIDVLAYNYHALDHWNVLTKCNLIIDATGDEVFAEAINSKAIVIRANGGECTILHTWVFADGLAAQAFLNKGREHACYRCLRPDITRPWRYDPRKDKTNLGEIVSARCGEGVYTPFSVEAPVIAAALALRMCLEWASGEPGPSLRTRIIEPVRAHDINDTTPKPAKNCPACSHLRD